MPSRSRLPPGGETPLFCGFHLNKLSLTASSESGRNDSNTVRTHTEDSPYNQDPAVSSGSKALSSEL